MGIGAVAEIGEDVTRFGERCLTAPRSALPAHLGKGRRRPVHELGQVMAADAGERAAAFWYLGRGVVRAARAKIGGAVERDNVGAELGFLGFEKSNTLGNARRCVETRDALCDTPCNLGWRQLAV